MRKLWLIFAQTVTISLAALFVLRSFYPSVLAKAGLEPLNSGQNEPQIIIKQAESLPSPAPQGSFSVAAKKAMPSVVNIFTSKKKNMLPQQHPFMDDPMFKHFFGDPDSEQKPDNSLGSGVIVSSEGYILTNNHVVEAADEIEVALADGRTFPATVVGTDPETDLAVLKVNIQNLPAITFSPIEKHSVGDVVLAIGNPFGVGQTVTQGIISAFGRSHLGINTFENFIQTDASINPGNSGGALVDNEGNLVGINSAIYSQSGGSMGIGFAIPSNLAQQVMEQIISQGSVTRGWVGIEAQDINPQLAESFKLNQEKGALIAGVLQGSPAERGGLRSGDVLIKINGTEVDDSSKMLNLIAGLKPNTEAKLTVIRNQKETDITILIGKRPKPMARQQ